MHSHNLIRKLTAGGMLVLFAISITPKQVFHDLITKHKHTYLKFDGTISLQASKNNFHCNWHDQPVKSPFRDQPDIRLSQPNVVYSSYINHYSLKFYSVELLFSSLRAPPTQA
jgi:hypothetical protein